jgi:hypothetical protein
MPRITSDIPAELRDFIKDFSEKNNRSFSKTVCLLLQQAVKERTRKRKNAKEDNT